MTNRLTLNFGILRLVCCKLFLGNVEVFYLCIKGHVYGKGGGVQVVSYFSGRKDT